MRTREEIERSLGTLADHKSKVILEVLLDIREKLEGELKKKSISSAKKLRKVA